MSLRRLRLALLVALFSAGLTAELVSCGKRETNYLCEGTFALCTSAPCVPLPNSNQAVCTCDVLDGPSMAGAPCDTVAPVNSPNGTEMVYSMFSLEQFTRGRQAMHCPADAPWTWCLDKP